MYQQDRPIGCTQVAVEGRGGKHGEGGRGWEGEGGREAGRRWEGSREREGGKQGEGGREAGRGREKERQESEEGNMGERDVKSKYSLWDRLLIMGHRMFQTQFSYNRP